MKDLKAEINGWFENRLEAIDDAYYKFFFAISKEEMNTLREEAIAAHQLFNSKINYLEKRMETLKAQIDEAKIFSSENVYYELKARLNELEALTGEQSLDILV